MNSLALPDSFESTVCRLEDTAAELTNGQRVPIDLAAVLRSTGAELEVRPDRMTDFVGALKHSANGSRIVLYDSLINASLSSRQRFTIAHEIGHYLLERWGIPHPAGKREYWMRERLCNRFAAALLVPDTAVRYAVAPHPTSSGDLYGRLRLIVDRAGVSPEVACKRIELAIDEFSSWEIEDFGKPGVLGRVRWIAGDAGTLGLNRAAYVPYHHRLGTLVEAARAAPFGHCTDSAIGDESWTLERRRASVWGIGLTARATWHQIRLGQPMHEHTS